MEYHKYMNYIKNKLDDYNLDNNKLFISIIIFLVLYLYLSNFEIKILIMLVIILYIIKEYYNINKELKDNNDTIKKNKLEYIRPNINELSEYDDIIDFLYYNQDLYKENAASYNEMVNSIKTFFRIYDETLKIPELANYNYSLLEIEMTNSVNLLHSIILNSLPVKPINDKITNAYKKLYTILNKYIDEVKLIIKKDIKLNGYNIHTKIIDNLKKPYNYSENSQFIFDNVF